MSIKVVDCRGMACPQPVIETKKALEEGRGKAIITIVDNETARENVLRFARNAGYAVNIEEKEGLFHLNITPAEEALVKESKAEKVENKAEDGVIYFITASTIGQGSPDLGEVLMKSLMTTLAEQHPPKALLFMNTGVFLTVDGSPVLEELWKMSKAGTEILACGSCLNYYKLKEKLAVGVVSNMYEINSRLSGPHKVITVG